MASYFSYFPIRSYTFDKFNNSKIVTDILVRSNFIKEISENISLFYEYDVQESDTPEIIAHKLYKNPYRHWIVLLFNKILDPLYEFPLKQDALHNFIKNKYNQTLAQSSSTIHHYELVIDKIYISNNFEKSRTTTTLIINENDVDPDSGEIVSRLVLPATADTSNLYETKNISLGGGDLLTINYTAKAVSNYTHEFKINESRRKIKLLDPKYITLVENEFTRLMANG